MLRCRQTAQLIYPQLTGEAVSVEDFRECDFGLFEGKNYQEMEHLPAYQEWVDSMIREGLTTPTPEELECSLDKRTLSLRTLLGQAVATSIDAFAVGVSFSLQGANIFAASPVIAVTTFICSLAALLLGQRFGRLLGSRAEVLGGVILLLIAAKAVL